MVGSVQGAAAQNQSAANTVAGILAKHHLSAKGNPFITFYLIIMDKMMGSQTNAETQNIDKFAGQLKNLTQYLNDWNAIKQQFDDAANNIWYNHYQPFCIACSKLLNDVFGKFMHDIGLPLFPENGEAGQAANFKALLSTVESSSNTDLLMKDCPTLGLHARTLIKSVSTLSIFFTTSHYQTHPDGNLQTLWNNAEIGGVPNPATGHGMANPEILQKYLDQLSDGNGILTGVSGAESSTLQMKQQTFNRLQSFIKNMLSDWVQMKKSFNSSMSQANN
ncbi:MAG: hypothetical protein P0S95_02125 [Rhabdochlamydiaceae bacterium]|nr:hypothetical protein [Candidatus Amphrikana amoebophyrae]